LYGKLFRPAGVGEAIRDLFRPAKALTAWRRAYALEIRGIPTPRSLAVAYPRGVKAPVISAFFSEAVPEAVCLDRYCARCRAGGREGGRRLRGLAAALGETVGRMHARGLAHRDLKAGNLLVPPDDPPRILLTDLDGLRIPGGGVSETRREKDLARLLRTVREDCGFTSADWMRLLSSYRWRSGAGDLRSLAARIASRAARGGEVRP
jgi:hypothetical protein